MNSFIYKNKNTFLRFKRKFNSVFGIEIIKYPTAELDRRIKLLQHYKVDVVLDVGANIGQFGSELRNIGFTGQIISFEPTSEAFEKLEKMSKNDSLWKINNFSLGEFDGDTNINISKNSVSSSILKNLPQLIESAPNAVFTSTEKIIVKKLDTIFAELQIEGKNIFLKIDTQGYEDMVITGANESLEKIVGLQVEMALIPTYENSVSFHDLSQKLVDKGFKITSIESGYYDKNSGKLLEVDGVFYKN